MCLTVSKQHCFWSEISDMVRLKESIVCFYHLISLTEQVKTVKNVLVMKIVLFIINVQENRKTSSKQTENLTAEIKFRGRFMNEQEKLQGDHSKGTPVTFLWMKNTRRRTHCPHPVTSWPACGKRGWNYIIYQTDGQHFVWSVLKLINVASLDNVSYVTAPPSDSWWTEWQWAGPGSAPISQGLVGNFGESACSVQRMIAVWTEV